MHIASLVKIPCYLLKLLSGNENMGVSRADNSVNIWRKLPINNPKSDLHNINVHIKFGENPLMFTHVIIRKQNTDGRTTEGRTDRHTDVLHETIIPRHYRVTGYKKGKVHHEISKYTYLRFTSGLDFIKIKYHFLTRKTRKMLHILIIVSKNISHY